MSDFLHVYNGQAFAADDCPRLPIEQLRGQVVEEVASGARLAALSAQPDDEGALRLVAVLAKAPEGKLAVASARVERQYPSLTAACAQAHWFEREIAEQWGIQPVGHPWLKPIRFQPPRNGKNLRPPGKTGTGCEPSERGAVETGGPAAAVAIPSRHLSSAAEIGITDFFHMEGEEVHEVAVGPVHAGIIEPGHFRFQCHGETVFHLEISLGYQHRGIERALVGGPDKRTIHYLETLSGDTTIGHTHAYCRVVESLAGARLSPRAEVIRGVAAELERIANHLGDLGALAGDVGFLPTQSFCGRIRGEALNLTALLCGNRFGRGLLRPGGVTFDLDSEMVAQMLERLATLAADARVAVALLWNTPSVTARFDGTGQVSPQLCRQIGLVGVAARACGSEHDTRSDFPYGIYRFAQIPLSTWNTGDVFARAFVRWLEVQRSLAFVREQLESLPEGPIYEPLGPLPARQMVVALVEGWRGAICHVAQTDTAGRFALYKIVDPSFHNWFGLACALRNQQISDFPLCNKSFNLSYCGHDL